MLTSNDEWLKGFTQQECNLVNEAVSVLISRGYAPAHAEDIAVNNWSLLRMNSIESLTGTTHRPDSSALN